MNEFNVMKISDLNHKVESGNILINGFATREILGLIKKRYLKNPYIKRIEKSDNLDYLKIHNNKWELIYQFNNDITNLKYLISIHISLLEDKKHIFISETKMHSKKFDFIFSKRDNEFIQKTNNLISELLGIIDCLKREKFNSLIYHNFWEFNDSYSLHEPSSSLDEEGAIMRSFKSGNQDLHGL